MKKENIILDFDGTMFNSLPHYIEFINQFYSINSTADDYMNEFSELLIVKKYKPEFVGSDNDFWLSILNNFMMSQDWHNKIKPFPGMCEVVFALSEKYNIWVATARSKKAAEPVRFLLETHVSDCISGIYFTRHFLDSTGSKAEFVKSLPGVKVAFIDNSKKEIIDMCKECNDQPISYLFDPHNFYANDKEIINRFSGWMDIGEKFL